MMVISNFERFSNIDTMAIDIVAMVVGAISLVALLVLVIRQYKNFIKNKN